MTKSEFKANAIYAVEIEYEDGGREWFTMKGTETQAFVREEAELGNYVSDTDFAGKQDNAEVQAILDKAWELFMNNTKKFKSYYEAIETFLEDDKPEKPAKKTWTEEQISDMIQKDDRVLYGALKKLYAEQTSDEKSSAQTTHKNGAGFNSVDAKFLTSTAEFLLRTGFLTYKQKEVVRRKLKKYTKQLTRLANA